MNEWEREKSLFSILGKGSNLKLSLIIEFIRNDQRMIEKAKGRELNEKALCQPRLVIIIQRHNEMKISWRGKWNTDKKGLNLCIRVSERETEIRYLTYLNVLLKFPPPFPSIYWELWWKSFRQIIVQHTMLTGPNKFHLLMI
jgi:hypothetical protein